MRNEYFSPSCHSIHYIGCHSTNKISADFERKINTVICKNTYYYESHNIIMMYLVDLIKKKTVADNVALIISMWTQTLLGLKQIMVSDFPPKFKNSYYNMLNFKNSDKIINRVIIVWWICFNNFFITLGLLTTPKKKSEKDSNLKCISIW